MSLGFSNLLDDDDMTFELPPHGFPVIQLQFPNSGSVEECVLLPSFNSGEISCF